MQNMYDENPIFRSLALIEERLCEKLTIETLADSLHFSKYHYQHLFRETVGDSVMRYVTRRRLALAAQELADKDSTILEIALKYGYDSHEGFTRSFRAHLGVTPTEYRKYHQSITSPATGKEKTAMSYTNAADEMIRELNGLIVQAKETAAQTIKSVHTAPKDAAVYAPFWDFVISQTDTIAKDLTRTLSQIISIPQRPDEISARFLIIKALDDAVFWSNLIAFQAGLTVARANPAHRAVWEPVCKTYEKLARDAKKKAQKVTALFEELAALIFRDMENEARRKIQRAVEAGYAAASALSAASCAWLAEEIHDIADGLSSTPPGEMTAALWEDCMLRLDIIAFAAGADALRSPSCARHSGDIQNFRDRMADAADFFENLPLDSSSSAPACAAVKKYRDLAYQGTILLLYMKGEIQKLDRLLDDDQRSAFASSCGSLHQTILLLSHSENEADAPRLQGCLQDVYDALAGQAHKLGACGAPIQYIADEIGKMRGSL